MKEATRDTFEGSLAAAHVIEFRDSADGVRFEVRSGGHTFGPVDTREQAEHIAAAVSGVETGITPPEPEPVRARR